MTGLQCISMYAIFRKYSKRNADTKAVVSESEQVTDNELEARFDGLTMWMVGTGIGIVTLIFTVIKLFVEK